MITDFYESSKSRVNESLKQLIVLILKDQGSSF